MGYSVVWHRNAGDIGDALWNACFPPPSERKWWYQALEGAGLEDQFTFFYGEIRRGTEAVGILPVFVMNVPMDLVAPPEVMVWIRRLGWLGRPLLFQRTLFIGNVAGEGSGLGIRRDAGLSLQEVLTTCHHATDQLRRQQRAKLIVWKDLTADAAQEVAGPLAGLGYFRIPSYPATAVKLKRTEGLEGYFKGLNSDYRYKLKKKMKASEKAGQLKVDVRRSPEVAELAEIWGLFWQTYERGGTKFEKFNPKVFDRFAAHPECHWLTLRTAEGRMVGFMLLTQENTGVWVNRFIGMDYAAPKDLFLYYRLFVEAVSVCCKAQGDNDIELLSGQTGYRAKVELGHELLAQDNFSRHRNPILHSIYAAVAKGISWATLDEDLKIRVQAHPDQDTGKAHWK